MKKLILAAMLTGLAAGAYAQGTVFFNDAQITPKVMTNDLGGHTGLATKNTFSVALYWGAAGSTEAQLIPIFTGVGTSGDGIFYFANAVSTPSGTAPGANAVFEVRGWTGNYATYADAVAGGAYVGSTGIFNSPTGGGGTPPGPAVPLTGWTGNLTLSPVPEPSTIALAGLGAASLLLFRRRK